jgi:MFS family permease
MRLSAGLSLIPRNVWTLGFVSMFMDISSEMIHALLPIYLVAVLGASALTVGFIEGVAEAAAMLIKPISGALSDWLGRRKLLASIGYGLSALSKPVFPLAASVSWIFAARLLDRIGKGIRDAPRDALIADISEENIRGASFGLRQSLDTAGAIIGPLLAAGLMIVMADNIAAIFWVAVIPAFLAAGLMIFAVSEPPKHEIQSPSVRLPRLASLNSFSVTYWMVVAVAAALTLARFSEAFLILKARNVGLPLALVPGVMVVMNIAYAISAYPSGALSDRAGRSSVVLAGAALLLLADVMLALAAATPLLLLGIVLWGLHMGLTQSVLAALVADAAPAGLRGTAFGVLNFVSGVALVAGGVIAGLLWDTVGPAMTFFAGAFFAALAVGGAALLWRHQRP